MSPHPQGVSLQQGDGLLRGEKVEKRGTVATDPGSHRVTRDRRRIETGKGCGARTAGQGSLILFGVFKESVTDLISHNHLSLLFLHLRFVPTWTQP